ncbi:hypothetical protein LEP1GSC038_3061 [Leptospira weilii str. 2006001855]|uniref:Uncharacterized protein n=1 Tax=Leptospira weilii str. 2006001855 TaxID=996804 RepID=M6FEM5_9LEPT|nr:hypothetical protein LEP1GSC038_3061 [Leptospira weilii str. 2006001855]
MKKPEIKIRAFHKIVFPVLRLTKSGTTAILRSDRSKESTKRIIFPFFGYIPRPI